MAFTYAACDGTNDAIDLVRALIADTVASGHIFEDSEILGFYRIQAAQFQSGQAYSGAAGANLPATPVSYLRVAALALDALASSKSRLSSVTEILDVKLSPAAAAKALHDQAAAYREVDDNSGAFAIIEQVKTTFDYKNRFWAQVMRQGV